MNVTNGLFRRTLGPEPGIFTALNTGVTHTQPHSAPLSLAPRPGGTAPQPHTYCHSALDPLTTAVKLKESMCETSGCILYDDPPA